MKLKIAEAKQQKLAKPIDDSEPRDIFEVFPVSHHDWSFYHTALRQSIDTEGAFSGPICASLAYAAARVVDPNATVAAARQAIKADPSLVGAYYGMAYLAATASPITKHLKSAERWLALAELCSEHRSIYEELKQNHEESVSIGTRCYDRQITCHQFISNF